MEDIVPQRTRPTHLESKKGAAGQKVRLLANCFKLLKKPEWQIRQYRVDFNPPIDRISTRKGLLSVHSEILGRRSDYQFDGTMLFMAKALPGNKQKIELTSATKEDQKIQIIIKMTKEVNPQTDPIIFQIFSILTRRCMHHIGLKLIGRNYYNTAEDKIKQIPQHKIMIYPGFAATIVQLESEIFMQCSVSHKIVRTDTVLSRLQGFYRADPNGYKEAAARALLGEIVMTKYNNKTYRIDDIDWNVHPSDTFKKGDEDITYVRYYKEQYETDIQDQRQPMLVTKPKKKDLHGGQEGPIYLIPELCACTGLTEEMRADFGVMRDVAVHTRLTPDKRAETLKRFFIDELNNNEIARQSLKVWELEFDKNLFEFDSRCLNPEKIYQGTREYGYRVENADWSREVRSSPLDEAKTFSKWIIVYSTRAQQLAQQFSQSLRQCVSQMGIVFNQPKPISIENDRTMAYCNALHSILASGEVEFVVCIVPNNNKERYEAIKKICCIDKPVPSQVIVQKTLNNPKNLMSVCTKIAIQMNCKMGGLVWHLTFPFKQHVMILGYDAYHDSQLKGTSVGVVISSLNAHFTRYMSQTIFHKNREELTPNMLTAMTNALKEYRKVNGELPQLIIFYRDGVSDGALNYVKNTEIKAIKDGIAVQGNYNPKFAFIVVTKRINQRFFEVKGRNVTNPNSGTIVDDHITRNEAYDFFLISQSVRQGTVSPTHYNIIEDSSGLKPDHFQMLTYKLTHLYYNWPGTIRVPAPCQYAHKLAFLTGQCLHANPHQVLQDKLFYL